MLSHIVAFFKYFRAPFIAILTLLAFQNRSLFEQLRNVTKDKVAGFVVIRTDISSVQQFSEDSQCPNENSCLYTSDLRNSSMQLFFIDAMSFAIRIGV